MTVITHAPHTLDIKVLWSDMDAYQHVNNAQYLLWLETARIDLAEQFFPGSTIIVARVAIDYLQQVMYPDVVRVCSYISRVGNSSCTLHSDIYSTRRESMVCRADVVLVHFDYQAQQSKPWPDAARLQLNKLQNPNG